MGRGFLDIFKVRDISVEGVGILVPHHFDGCDLECEVELLLTLPSERPFLAKGVVVHRTQAHEDFFGVFFTELSKPSRNAIRRYVQKRLNDFR